MLARIPVESLFAHRAVDARGRTIHIQAHATDAVLEGRREDEGLLAYEVDDTGGNTHLIVADGPRRAADLLRYALRMIPKGEARLVGDFEIHPSCV